MGDNVADGTPLTPVDTAWLHMEDPTNLMMVTGIYVFDEPVDFDRLKDTVRVRMVERFPRLRHKVRQSGASARLGRRTRPSTSTPTSTGSRSRVRATTGRSATP